MRPVITDFLHFHQILPPLKVKKTDDRSVEKKSVEKSEESSVVSHTEKDNFADMHI